MNLFFIYYSADLTATMTSKPKDIRLESFQDVEDQGYKVVSRGNGRLAYNNLKNSPNGSAMQRLYRSDRHIVVNTIPEVKEKSMEDPKMLVYGPHPYSKLEDYLVALDVLETLPYYKTIVMQKDSEFTELFNRQFLMMQESGVIQRIMRKWRDRRDMDYGIAEPISLGYSNLLFPINLLAGGMVMATLIGVVEHSFKKSTKKSTGGPQIANWSG